MAYCRVVGEKEPPYKVVKMSRRMQEMNPDIVEMREYGDGTRRGKVVGPEITEEEEKEVERARAVRREKRLAVASARKAIKAGKQKPLTAYFRATKKGSRKKGLRVSR